MAISREQVWEAADGLVAASAKVTLDAVRTALGSGSFATIRKHLAEWRNRRDGTDSAAQVPVPDSLAQMASKLVNEAWTSALTAADRRIAAEREALREASEQAERDVCEVTALADKLQTELAGASERIAALEATVSEGSQELTVAKREVAAEASARAALEQEILRREVAYAELQKNANEYLARASGMDARIHELQRVNDSLVYKLEPRAPSAKVESAKAGRN